MSKDYRSAIVTSLDLNKYGIDVNKFGGVKVKTDGHGGKVTEVFLTNEALRMIAEKTRPIPEKNTTV